MYKVTTTRENNKEVIEDILSSSIYNIGDIIEITFYNNSKIEVIKDKNYPIKQF
jgi:hypothetical protein